jgi:hypothetical protein
MVPNPGEESNRTYAMANITSVSTKRVSPSYTGAVLVLVVGLIFAVGGFVNAAYTSGAFGIVILGAGIGWMALLKPDYHLQISSAGGESTALKNKDKAYVEKLVQAIHEAIIHRG